MSDSETDEEELTDLLALAWLLLDDEPVRRNKPRIGQSALPSDPKTQSPWAAIWRRGDDRTLVKVVNLDRASFQLLLGPFSRQFKGRGVDGKVLKPKKIKARARLSRRKMTADGCLGLTLMWLSSMAEIKYLGLLFGLNEHCAWKYIRLGCHLLFKVREAPAARSSCI